METVAGKLHNALCPFWFVHAAPKASNLIVRGKDFARGQDGAGRPGWTCGSCSRRRGGCAHVLKRGVALSSAVMRELLPVRERLALPGEWRKGAIFVSSDAARKVIGAIDWTNGLVMRMSTGAAARWVDHYAEGDEVVIHVAEMLSLLAFACKAGEMWCGKAVLYGGNNKIVREWIEGRKSGTVVGRLLVRPQHGRDEV